MGYRVIRKKLEREVRSREHFSLIWENNGMLYINNFGNDPSEMEKIIQRTTFYNRLKELE